MFNFDSKSITQYLKLVLLKGGLSTSKTFLVGKPQYSSGSPRVMYCRKASYTLQVLIIGLWIFN